MAKRSNEEEILKRIGRLCYSRKERLGKGSFGSVFKGKFKESEKKPEIDVAIKRIEQIEGKDVEKIVMGEIKPHPNVLHYYCVEEDVEFIYIATELCAGTLDDIINGTYKGPPVGSTREIIHQIALGVEHLHNNNIAHRDIKPANILVSFPNSVTNEPPRMKLADFGLCRVVNRDGSKSLFTKCGTRGWIAPEMYGKVPIKNGKEMLAVDIFALGCVFAYFLSKGNQHPYGTGNLRDYRMENNEEMILTVEDFDHCGAPGVFKLIRFMLRSSGKRYTIKNVIGHPFFNEVTIDQNNSSSLIDTSDYESIISSLTKMEVGDSSFDVKSTDINGRTPLMYLCSKIIPTGNLKLRDYVEKFLNLLNYEDKVVNAVDNSGKTALTFLCEHYNGDDLIDIIRLLIDKGVDVNQVTIKNGFNALMVLCMQYNHNSLVDIIQLFIENGVDINTTSSDDGWNVLHILCRYYNSEKLITIIALLIENGIELNKTTAKDGWNAITFLSSYYKGNDMHDIFNLLVGKGIDITAKTKDLSGMNSLGWICSFYKREDLIGIIRLLIEKDPSVINCINNNGRNNVLATVCLEYSRGGADNLISIISLLIEKGIDVNNKSISGWNALMVICRYYHRANLAEIVHLLFYNKIEVNSRTNNGSNAFLLLCENRNIHHDICLDVVRLFIDLKADVNVVHQIDLNNALTLLCNYHHSCDKLVDIIRLILDHNSCTIDVNHKNKKGEDAMYILRNKGSFVKKSEEIMKLLIEHGAHR